MRYRFRKEESEKVRLKYKGQYFMRVLGISKSYLSLVLTGKRAIPRYMAFAFTKAIDIESEVEDYFDEV